MRLVKEIIFADINIRGPLIKVQATILVAIRSMSIWYCVAITNTPGADGNVPYKNAYVLKSVVSETFVPACKMLTVCRLTNGKTNLKVK